MNDKELCDEFARRLPLEVKDYIVTRDYFDGLTGDETYDVMSVKKLSVKLKNALVSDYYFEKLDEDGMREIILEKLGKSVGGLN